MNAEPFKRGAKVTFAIRKPELGEQLRALLTARIRPMLDYLASELAALATARFESEVERMAETLEVGVSAFASELATCAVEPPASPPRPPPTVQSIRATEVRERSKPRSSASPPPVRAASPPPPVTAKGKPRERSVMRCRKCGALGFRADGCGTSHKPEPRVNAEPTTPPRRLNAKPEALAAAVARKSKITSRAREILDRTRSARADELPVPRSSFRVTPRDHSIDGEDLADVEELDAQ